MTHPSPGPGRIALTYANDKKMDGAGAQLQRLYGVYAIARFLNISYFHSPIKELGYQGLSAVENDCDYPGMVSRYNRVFTLPSDVPLPDHPVIHEIKEAHIDLIENIREAAAKDGEFHLVRIEHPHSVTDLNPEMYRCLKAVSPFAHKRSKLFKIAIHVRRGEVVTLARILPNSYFVSAALRLTEVIRRLGIRFSCKLYTEVPSRSLVVTRDRRGFEELIADNATIDPNAYALEDFEAIPNLTSGINLDPLETLQEMITADALIISRSSFSYTAGLLSRNGIIIYHPFWHNPLEEWITSDGDGHLDEPKLIEQLASWKTANRFGGCLDLLRSLGLRP